jgi:hypothetical protein
MTMWRSLLEQGEALARAKFVSWLRQGRESSRSDVLDDLGAALAREISTAGAIVSYLHLDATRTADWHERFSNYSGDHIFIAGVHGRLRLEETGEEEWYRATMTSKQLDWA